MDFINFLKSFFDSTFFTVFSGISTSITAIVFIYVCFLIWRGILPVLYRLGKALAIQKIAIFASAEYESLQSMLVDSGLFNKRNIIKVNKNDKDKVKNAKLFLVHWEDNKDELNDILRIKSDSTALIVYAPQHEGRIGSQEMDQINSKRNSIVVNLRGRLVNDVLISMITSNYTGI